jgi:AcrR family transcriptional regulator
MRQRLTREERQQQTRERLLDAALAVFSQRGYHATSVDEVAEAAGFSKGAVYSNFASKEELFLALLDRHFTHEMATWGTTPPQDASEPPRDFAESIQQARTWNLLLIEFLLYAIREERVRPQIATRLRVLNERLSEHLASIIAAGGSTPPLPLPRLTWVINALGTGLSLHTYIDPDGYPPGLYEQAFTVLLGGPPTQAALPDPAAYP